MSGKVQGSEYDKEFRALFHQYNMCSQSIQDFKLDPFMNKYNLIHCQSAKLRIVEGRSGYRGEETDRNIIQRVHDITQKFISAMDVIAMNADQVDDVDPPIRELHQALLNYPGLPPEYTGLKTVQGWVTTLSQKKAHETLSQDELRQLKMDLQNEYTSYDQVVLRRH